jgi:hypothetical protein
MVRLDKRLDDLTRVINPPDNQLVIIWIDWDDGIADVTVNGVTEKMTREELDRRYPGEHKTIKWDDDE